jgi:hypothetical protein
MTRTMWIGALLIGLLGTARSEAGTYTFTPLADAQVMSDAPTTNYGTGSRLTVDGGPAAQSLVRFNVNNIAGTVTSARLRIYVNNPSPDGPTLYRTSSNWSETAVTWNTRPSPTSGALGDLATVNSGTWVEYAVTSTVTSNGTYDFLLTSSNSDGSIYHSRESAEKPQLVVVTSSTTTPPPPPPPPPPTEPPPPTGSTVTVTLQPAAGVSGTQRVNFAVPMPRGMLLDPDRVRVMDGSTELAAARRELALWPDGSVRSVQVQVTTPVSSGKQLTVRINEAPTTAAGTMVPVSTLLVAEDGTSGPRVWARLPAAWLAPSGVVGPMLTEASVDGTNLDVFDNVCNYASYGVSAFLSLMSSKDVWLYDRGTALYRGHARRGDQSTLESAYRETAIYRARITGTDAATRIGVPGAADDLKYHYAQNLAIHYLMTGDDRFRESAEDIATRVAALWSSPGYAGGSDFWTERHAGFGLLAYVWARIVTDNEAAILDQRADAAVDAYLAMQAQYPTNWTDSSARCFAHTAASASESYGTWGCSPWMSAIIADGLDAYATEKGGTKATQARAALVKLGKIIARDGRNTDGKPYYWMGIGSAADQVDPYNEHWGEPAYVVAMAYYHGGKSDASLKTAAEQMLAGLKSKGTVPHLRSFNWQCRSSVAAPFYLK